MRKGICVAGNLIADITYPIERWPRQSELTTITDGITRSIGEQEEAELERFEVVRHY